ncbi:MAG TPA: hypothetical protein VN436_10565, partial [Holophaga sp.]|nr:hypothetical protein [Holophaga sp.]
MPFPLNPDPGALLEALGSLGLPDAPKARTPRTGERGPDRHAWHLAPARGSLQVDVLACHPIPRGWREGERIPPRDLPEPGRKDWGELCAEEQAAFEAFHAWRRHPAGLPLALLAALEGHTRLGWASSPGGTAGRVALARELSVLAVRRVPEGWRISLSQRPGAGAARLRVDGDRVLLTPFGPIHRALDALLEDGRTVPDTAAPRLAAIL